MVRSGRCGQVKVVADGPGNCRFEDLNVPDRGSTPSNTIAPRPLEDQSPCGPEPCPRVCRLVALGPPSEVLCWLKLVGSQSCCAPVLAVDQRLVSAASTLQSPTVRGVLLRLRSCLALDRRPCLVKTGLAVRRGAHLQISIFASLAVLVK